MPSYSPTIYEIEADPFWLTPVGEATLEQVRDAQSSSPNVSETSFVSEAALEAYDRLMLDCAEGHDDRMARRQFHSDTQQRIERIRQLAGEYHEQFAEMMAQHEERMAEIHRQIEAAQKEQEWLKKCNRLMVTFGVLALLPVLLAVDALFRYYS